MNGGTRLRTRVAATCLAATAALAIGTLAQAAPAPAESIAVSPSVVEGGAQITIVGSGWFCAADVNVFVDDGGLRLVTSVSWDDIVDGGFSVVSAAPDAPGEYDMIAEYGNTQTSVGCEGRATDSFTVVVSSTTTTVAATTTNVVDTTTTTTIAATTTTLSDATTSTTTTLVGNEGPTTTTGPVSTLPVTGASASTIMSIAIVTIALGGLFALTTRRRTVR